MWKAKLISIQGNTAPNRYIHIEVHFSTDTQNCTLGYELEVKNYKTLAAINDFISTELTKLNDFEEVATLLVPYLGKEDFKAELEKAKTSEEVVE